MHSLETFTQESTGVWERMGVMSKWEEMCGVQQCPSPLGGGAEVKVLR